MPPPSSDVFPLAIVRPEMLAVTPEFTVNTLKFDDGLPPRPSATPRGR